MASLGANHSSYDVFLSFSGDTRHSFTDHLYDKLKQAGIGAFRDSDEINRGEELKPEIETAIEGSRASIVVLSKKYATSSWCLDELSLILKQRRECYHFVLPVFYHVEPSDVRNQRKTFAMEVNNSGKWTDTNVKRWKEALTEVANLDGEVVSGPETEHLAVIVDTIYNKVDLKLLSLPPNLVGMGARDKDINSWLEQSDANFLVIHGMRGSGKSTLAKYILNSNRRKFDSISFVENIASRYNETGGLLLLQRQLLKDILGGKNRKIPGVSRGTCKIEEALQKKKALVILDDIDEEYLVKALLGNGEIHSQSKIIITTSGRFRGPSMCGVYEMELLNDDESLELLSRHAFGSKIPMEGFEELAVKAVRYCEGNPLGLEVLARDLCEDNTIQFWKSKLKTLYKGTHSTIEGVLITSYKSLKHDSLRQLFLHIACFFVGKDVDYVTKILEPDYYAVSGIITLTNRCLLSVSPNNKLMMHRLLQEMGRTIVTKEASNPAKRSRVWRNDESYKILRRRKGSKTMEGLAFDMQKLMEEDDAFKEVGLKTDSLQRMDNLKLLQFKDVELIGSYENFSEHLRWLCWIGFCLETIPPGLFMGNLVALDMSCSLLEVFEPPTVLKSLQILNLKDSYYLCEIRNIGQLPNLETLILWNCYSLVHVCETIGRLKSLAQLNMTGCARLFTNSRKQEHINPLEPQIASTSGGGSVELSIFSLPHSLQQLFLMNCKLECTDYFPLSFSGQSFLQYLNLVNGLFEFLPDYNHLKNLRVLDLTCCSKLKRLLRLPSTLAELYTYYCESLEIITFQSSQFTLQEFGYEGCVNLSEIEGFIKLVAIAKLDETDLGHLKWLKEYQDHEMCLVGDDELTIGRSWFVQMLYEFDIMSTSLPDIKDPNMRPEYMSETPSFSFDVPLCPKHRRLKGLNLSFKYTMSGEDWAWFAKINTTNGVDLMYNPRVCGKPASGEVATWFSYWPIGKNLDVGDKVNVSIVVMSGLEVHECGATLVYTDEEGPMEDLERAEILGGDLSGFQLSTGAYYLCRRDFFELMEVGRLTRDWFRILVGDTIDYTEIRGWRKTGRAKQLNRSYEELKVVRCIIDGLEWEQIYRISERSKPSFFGELVVFKSSTLWEMIKPATTTSEIGGVATKKVVIKVDVRDNKDKTKAMKAVLSLSGVDSIAMDMKEKKMTAVGDFDPMAVIVKLRKHWHAEILTVGPAKEEKKKDEPKKEDPKRA